MPDDAAEKAVINMTLKRPLCAGLRAPPRRWQGNGPSDQLSIPSVELGIFDAVSKRAGCPDRELLRRGAMVLEPLSR
eukprot:1620018-Alexandrium_andersonii.AAC.1